MVHKSRFGAACLFSACVCAGAVADTESGDEPVARPLPAWAVLVLQPVGDKRVRPVTGAVVSAAGTVVVPADFAALGDVLIVLDGGSDIIEHGRAATVRARDEAAGITLLDVPGLVRPPAVLAATPPAADAVLHLAAFPPAEQIAAGAAPLWLPARAGDLRPAPDEAPTAGDDGAGPLPNVSGPLLDHCGHLAGYSLADGVPGMQAVAGTRYAWSDALAPALHLAAIPVAAAACLAASTEPAAAVGEGLADPVPATRPAPAGVGPQRPVRGEGAGRVPRLAWYAVVLGVLAAALAAWRFRRRRSRAGPGLLQDTGIVRAGARRPPAGAPENGPAAAAPAGWQLELRGQLPSGAGFVSSCPVNPAAIDVVIGSGAAGLMLDAPGIRREHIRLGGSAGALTITDLGSATGTWINRVPCTRGEIMFLAGGATVVLGETSFQVKVLPPAGTAAPDRQG